MWFMNITSCDIPRCRRGTRDAVRFRRRRAGWLSWCDQKETGLCDQKENNDLSPLPQESGLIISPVASAEDRALRGRNLSAG